MSIACQTYCHLVADRASEIGHLAHVEGGMHLNRLQRMVLAGWQRFGPMQTVLDHLRTLGTQGTSYRVPTISDRANAANSLSNRVVHGRTTLGLRIRREASCSWRDVFADAISVLAPDGRRGFATSSNDASS